MKSKLTILSVLIAFVFFAACNNNSEKSKNESSEDLKKTTELSETEKINPDLTTESDETEGSDLEDSTELDVSGQIETPAGDSSGKTFVSEKFKFSVDFPGSPLEQVDDVPAEGYVMKMYSFIYDEADQVFFVAVSTLPEILKEEKGLEQEMLDGSVEGLLGIFTTTENVIKKDIKRSGYPAKFVELTGKRPEGEMYFKSNIILTEEYLYQVYVLAYKGKEEKDRLDKFIKSFKINK